MKRIVVLLVLALVLLTAVVGFADKFKIAVSLPPACESEGQQHQGRHQDENSSLHSFLLGKGVYLITAPASA